MTTDEIQRLIQQGMPEAQVTVSGAEGKFTAEVVAAAFAGLTLIKRHKLVYTTVNDQIASGELHALSIVAKTPEEAAG